MVLLPACEAPESEVESAQLGAGFLLPPSVAGNKNLKLPPSPSEQANSKADSVDVMANYTSIYGFTDAPETGARSLAEWERMNGVVLRVAGTVTEPGAQDTSHSSKSMHEFFIHLLDVLHDTVRVHVLVDHAKARDALIHILDQQGVPLDHLNFVEFQNDSIWARDFGPLMVDLGTDSPAFVDPRYYDSRRRDDAIPTLLAHHFDLPVFRPPLYAEGGNFMSNGKGLCVMTVKLLQQNPMQTKEEIKLILKDYLGCTQSVLLQNLQGEETGNVDMQAKLIREDAVLVGAYNAIDDPINAEILDTNAETLALLTLEDGRPVQVYRIPMPPHVGGVFRSFTNSLILNDKVFVPTYEEAESLQEEALAAYAAALSPEMEVVAVDTTDFVHWGGAIHSTVLGIRSASTLPVGPPEDNKEPDQEIQKVHVHSASVTKNVNDEILESAIYIPDGLPLMELEEVILTVDIDHPSMKDLVISVEHAGLEGTIHKGEYTPWESTPAFSTRAFSKTDARGVWLLRIKDIVPGGATGTFRGWSMEFTEIF